MTPQEMVAGLRMVADRAGQIACICVLPAAGLWLCVCKLGWL